MFAGKLLVPIRLLFLFSGFLQPHRNLSQLPNFAFSVSLALFHSCYAVEEREGCGKEREGSGTTSDADEKFQEALIMFPSVRTY